MTNQIEGNHSVYPGEYKPIKFDLSGLRDELNVSREGAGQPVCNIIECADHYKIGIVVPGHSKGDFVVTTDKGQLNIFAIRRKSQFKQESLYHSHEINYDFFEHGMLLPENIDTDFVRAEYRDGIVTICFQKTDKPVLNTFHRIIVY